MAAQQIKVPDIGDFDAVEVIEVLVAAGDELELEQPLITLESDKATLEVPATTAGKLTEIKVAEGDSVSEGDVIALVEASDAGSGSTDESGAGAATTAEASSASSDDAGRSGSEAVGETVEVKVPDIGDFDSVEVIEVLVSAGDTVADEQPLITLESDKATLEVPATRPGKLTGIKVKEGDTVSEGDVIADLAVGEEDREQGAGKPKEEKETEDSADETQTRQQIPEHRETPAGQQHETRHTTHDTGAEGAPSKLHNVDEAGFSKAHASPGVRKYARELGADLARIQGSGRKGRILTDDVQAYVEKVLQQVQGGAEAGAPAGGGGVPAQPDIDYSQFGDVETVELSRIRKVSARTVHNNWLLIPQVTQFDQADITELEAFRKNNKDAAAAEGVKLTPLVFMLKASASALQAFPDLNSSLTADCEHLVRKKYCHIGVAVDTPNGLLMPVIRNVDQKGIYQLARDLDDVSSRARDGKLGGGEMKGASFSISSLGGVGGTAFTPIVNSPEVAMLGVSKHDWQPVWNGSEFVPRLMLPLSLSYDHRVIDGAEAARITGSLAGVLGDIRKLLL